MLNLSEDERQDEILEDCDIIQPLLTLEFGKDPELNQLKPYTLHKGLTEDEYAGLLNVETPYWDIEGKGRKYSREPQGTTSFAGFIKLLSNLWPCLFRNVETPAELSLLRGNGSALTIQVHALWYLPEHSISKGPIIALLGVDQIPERRSLLAVFEVMSMEHFPSLDFSNPQGGWHFWLRILIPQPKEQHFKCYRGVVNVAIRRNISEFIVSRVHVEYLKVDASSAVGLKHRFGHALSPELVGSSCIRIRGNNCKPAE